MSRRVKTKLVRVNVSRTGRVDVTAALEVYFTCWNYVQTAKVLGCSRAAVKRALSDTEIQSGIYTRARNTQDMFTLAACKNMHEQAAEARANYEALKAERKADREAVDADSVTRALAVWGAAAQGLARAAGIIRNVTEKDQRRQTINQVLVIKDEIVELPAANVTPSLSDARVIEGEGREAQATVQTSITEATGVLPPRA